MSIREQLKHNAESLADVRAKMKASSSLDKSRLFSTYMTLLFDRIDLLEKIIYVNGIKAKTRA